MSPDDKPKPATDSTLSAVDRRARARWKARANTRRDVAGATPAAASEPFLHRATVRPATALAPVVARVFGTDLVDVSILRYAETRTREALRRFSEIRAVEILLGSGKPGEATCRLHVRFVGGTRVQVAHSGPAILHTIDIAVETTAHVVSCRLRPSG